ncbi:uncharacterized protein LOC131432752 [Malaya genurostris]|uniref:uncharacterized protein LOC131432752 n=1 Tax=Malaya genurostris TaxID=325434 RepID=UPI0026F3EDAE|nr:uncharacterized protein LOC131432752 [Malaya genurostris]
MANENNIEGGGAYRFPMLDAIQCIPEFHGSVNELEPFLCQISYFAEQIPQGANEKPLANVILKKLKGNAATFINRIRANTINDVFQNLRDQFAVKVTVEEILIRIETLEQKYGDFFEEYAERALQIMEFIDTQQENQVTEEVQKSFAERALTIHFIAGLSNKNLKQLAKNHRLLKFQELIGFLKEEAKISYILTNIENRLLSYHAIDKPKLCPSNKYKCYPERQIENSHKYNRNLHNEFYRNDKCLIEDSNFDSKHLKYNAKQLRVNCMTYSNRNILRRYDNNTRSRKVPDQRRYGASRYSNANNFKEKRPEGIWVKLHNTKDYEFMMLLRSATRPNNEMSFLVDTGACGNMISRRNAEYMGAYTINGNEVIEYSGVTGTVRKTLGTVELNFIIAGRIFQTKFNVVENLTPGGILGMRFMNKYVLSMHNDRGWICLRKIPLTFEPKTESYETHQKQENRVPEYEAGNEVKVQEKYQTEDQTKLSLQGRQRTETTKNYTGQLQESMQPHELLKINCTRNNQLLVRIASVNRPNEKIKYMLDTGAFYNVMRWDTVAKIGAEEINYKDNLYIAGFDGTQSQTIGSVKITLIIGKTQYRVRFYIVKDLCVPGIIGAEFLKIYKIYVTQNFECICLRVPNEYIKTEYIPISKKENFNRAENYGTRAANNDKVNIEISNRNERNKVVCDSKQKPKMLSKSDNNCYINKSTSRESTIKKNIKNNVENDKKELIKTEYIPISKKENFNRAENYGTRAANNDKVNIEISNRNERNKVVCDSKQKPKMLSKSDNNCYINKSTSRESTIKKNIKNNVENDKKELIIVNAEAIERGISKHDKHETNQKVNKNENINVVPHNNNEIYDNDDRSDSMLPFCGTNIANEKEHDLLKRYCNEEDIYLLDLESNQDLDLTENKRYGQTTGQDRTDKVLETLNTDHLKRENFVGIERIMATYSDVFYLKGDKLTITDAAVHEIETTSNVPINKRQYRFPEATKKHINDEIEEMRRQGIIRPSKSPWNAPVLCVPKKDDEFGNKKYRIVVDFRALNLVTKPFVYPIPLIDEILDNLGNSKYFSTLDLKSGFYQVPINSKDAAKTAFSTPKGHFEFTRMPMGLRNSPSTFQRLMNTVLYEIKDVKAIVYLDYIIVFGSTIEEHNDNLCKVLRALRRHNLKVEPGKCQILKTEIKYLGHAIDKEGIRPTEENIKAMKEMIAPRSVKGVRSFLGTVNFYGKFIPHIAEKRKPLNDLLRKNVKFVWTNECQKAFEELRNFLTSDALLVRPNYKDVFVITTDASEYALGAVLSNEKSIDRPISYASRGLVGAERKYHTIEKELYAIVWAVNRFKHFIYNQRFIVYTDHRPLISIWHLKETSPTLTRLRLKLQGLEMDIRYKQGKDNVVADFLSRLPEQAEALHPISIVTRQQKRQQQQAEKIELAKRKDAENKTTSPKQLKDESGRFALFKNKQKTEWNPHMDGLENIDFGWDEKEDLGVLSYFEEYEICINNNDIKFDLLKFSKQKTNESDFDGTFVIVNSRSAYKELAELIHLPYGLKDYLNGRVFSIPDRKIWGLVLNGSSRSITDTRILIDGLVDAFTNCPEDMKNAKNMLIISFRNMQKTPEANVLRFIAEKFDKIFTLYAPEKDRMWVPEKDRETTLKEFLDAPLGGHVGSKRMLKRMSPLFRWTNMRKDIENYVKQCSSCQKNKIGRANKIPMRITTTSSEPFEKLYMDIVVLPESEWGNRYGLVMQDDLTRYLIVAPMENQESATVAQTFVNNYICKYGTPAELVTDNGTNFVSSLMKNVCKILKIKKITTSAYHPQANLVERSNRELKTYLRQYVGNEPKTWDQLLPFFSFEYNTTVNSSTGYTPFELLYGRRANIPNSVYKYDNDGLYYEDYVNEMRSTFKRLHHQARENLIASKHKRKELYDKNSNEWQPMWGDLVLVKTNPTGAGQKLQSLWRGPYEVVALPSEQTTTIKNGNRLEKIHNNRLKRYTE